MDLVAKLVYTVGLIPTIWGSCPQDLDGRWTLISVGMDAPGHFYPLLELAAHEIEAKSRRHLLDSPAQDRE